MSWRRSAIRVLFKIWRGLGITDGDPTLDLHSPPRPASGARALTEDEALLCRWAALASPFETRHAAVWALAESGATSFEIAQVQASDVELPAETVHLRGSTATEPRMARLTEWGTLQLRRRIEHVTDCRAALAYEGSGSPPSMQASICSALTDVFRRAGLGDDPNVKPRSVRAWIGRSVLDETGRIEAVAIALGLRSLDRTAALIGWHWRD